MRLTPLDKINFFFQTKILNIFILFSKIKKYLLIKDPGPTYGKVKIKLILGIYMDESKKGGRVKKWKCIKIKIKQNSEISRIYRAASALTGTLSGKAVGILLKMESYSSYPPLVFSNQF